MATPPSTTTVAYVSGCQSGSCGCQSCGGGSCGCGAGNLNPCDTGHGCDCGTDCATGTCAVSRGGLSTPHGGFSYSFYNLFTQGGAPANPNFGMGTNFLPDSWAFATASADNEIGFVFGPTRAYWFNATTLAPSYGTRLILTVLGSGDWRLNDPDSGMVYVFDATTGLLASTTTPGGQSTINTIVDGQITESSRSYTYTQCGVTTTTTEVRAFDYFPSGSGGSSGLLQYVTLQRPDSSASAIRRLAMTYYDTGTSGGNAGDLQTVTVQLLKGTTWETVSTEYYRYYTTAYDGTSSTPPGYVHGLKFVVGPEAYARLSRVANPLTAPDATVAQFADVYYEYTQLDDGAGGRRVTRAVTDAGTLNHTFSYQPAPDDQPLGYNDWYLQSTGNCADGSQKITFSNYVRQVMLTDLWDTPGDQSAGRWITYATYDPTCDCVTACYFPSAINMSASLIYDPGSPTLSVALNPGTGLVQVYSYVPSGAAAGLPASEGVQQGASGSPITVKQNTYASQTVGTSPEQTTIVLPASATMNQSDSGGGSDPTTTNYAYTFFSSPTATVQVQTVTTTLPQIPTSQNGEGDNPATDPLYVIVQTLDIQGRTISTTDPYDSNNVPSFIPSVTLTYDEPTGAVIQQVQNPYSGTPPTDSEYNITTDYQVDDLGRTVQTLGPTFNSNGQMVRTASWTVYRDLAREMWSASGFATGSNNGPRYAFTLVNPVSIAQMDRDGRTTDQLSAVRESTDGPLTASNRFPQSSWVRWTHNTYDDPGDLVATRVYHQIPREGAGEPGMNYNETRFGYDMMDRQNMVRSPGGTITRTVFDVRDNPVQTYVGSNDFGATDEAPDGFGAPGNNMVNTQTNVYDNGDPVGGDGLLTQTVNHIDGTTANDRQITYAYDFRDRQTSTTSFIVPTGTISSVVTVEMFDNLGRTVQTDQYNTTLADANRIGESQSLFDDLGRVYQTLVYAVPITGGSAGTPSTPQTSDTWYNAKNQPLKRQAAGSQAYAKTQYDEVSRPSVSLTGYAATGGDDPWTVGSGDHVLKQTVPSYDLNSNVIQTTAYQRNQGATSATGLLTGTNSRVSYRGAWFDGIGRSVATANYGTTSFDRSSVTSPPGSSSVVQVLGTAYNNRGEAFETTDARGVLTRTNADDAGRPIETIQNYQPGVCGSCDANVTTRTTYAPDGGVATLTAVNPATGDQTTRNLYGTALGNGNAIARSDLLAAVVYPNATDATDQVTYQYNLQSQVQQKQDQNGNVHQLTFDGLGRTTSDVVSTLASSVDGALRRIDMAYEIRGMVSQVTSYSDVAGTTAVNQVIMTYNEFAQLVSDAQNHSGSGGSPPAVNYGYADGTANTIRRTSITYPNGRVLNVNYATGTEDDILSRVTDMMIAGSSTATVGYTYFGVSSVASVTYPIPDVATVLASGSSYPGLDAFDRIDSLAWTKTLPGDLVDLAYGYDENNNRTYRQDLEAGTSNEQDQIYAYDDLQRLITFRQGGLDVESPNYLLTTLVFAQDWSLDATGNWSEFSQFDASDTGNGLDQQRTSNAFNEITAISQTVGTQWATPTYDRNGNMTTIPAPAHPADGNLATYDAWNRMAGETTSGGTAVAAYQYDGLNRRIVVESYNSSGTSTETRDLYYSDQWQVLEERVEPSANAERQYVWGLRYVDDCVMRDRDTTGGGTFNERLFAVADANWNVVAICDSTGTIQERYSHTPYGVAKFYDSTWGSVATSVYDWQYLFQSGRLDFLTGLYYFRNRDYSPALGRWVSTDPQENASSSRGNLYLSFLGNPIRFTDPSGLDVRVIWVEGAQIDAGVAGVYENFFKGNHLENFIINPLKMEFKAAEDVKWTGYKAALGVLKPQKARLIEQAGTKCMTDKEKIVLIGYSWGGEVVITAMHFAFLGVDKLERKTPSFAADLVFTIDPVVGLPPGEEEYSNAKGVLNKGEKEQPLLWGKFGQWHNWYQRVDDGGSIKGLKVRGKKLLDPRITNTQFTKADFRNPNGAHVEIVTKPAIRKAISDGISKLRQN